MSMGSTNAEKAKWRSIRKAQRRRLRCFPAPVNPEPLTRQIRRAMDRETAKQARA